ncbi:MAG: uroporphyrinogen decarboxylase [Dongiaceae bacterium]
MSDENPLIAALHGKSQQRIPLWLMRQAGRYLPEYRAIRQRVGGFLELCLTPELAAEVTLQPLRRFPLDAAILFSDILIIPHALGQAVRFAEGEGPILEPIGTPADLARLSSVPEQNVFQAVEHALRLVKRDLPKDIALIGFAGAPWTVASYMVEGGGSKDFSEVKGWAYRDPDSFQRLIDRLVDVTSAYLIRQVEAGADVLQIFDSWVGVLPERELVRWGLQPTMEIVRRVKAAKPQVPIIVFPRGVGLQYGRYADEAGVDALCLDTTMPLGWAARELQQRVALQGNLDPVLLATGGHPMRQAATEILDSLGRGPFVFNLGHGVLPNTPAEHVAELCTLVQDWRP